MEIFPSWSLPAAGERPAGSRALAARCRGCRHSGRVLGAPMSTLPLPLPKILFKWVCAGCSGSQEPPCIGMCWLCSSLDLLEERTCGLLDSQDGWVACAPTGIHHHPQVHVGRDSTQLLALRALHWSLWKFFLLPTFPICLTSHRPARLAEPCSACWMAVPVVPAGAIALAAHRDVFLEAVGLQHSGPPRRKSRQLSCGRRWGWWLLSRTVS